MIIHEPDLRLAARKVMELVNLGHAQIAMKGKIETGDFLRAALDKEAGLRVGRLLTHVGIFEIPGFDRLIFISDAGVVVAPTMEQKIEIVQNAIYVAQRLGVEQPRVAILAATEMVNPKIWPPQRWSTPRSPPLSTLLTSPRWPIGGRSKVAS